MNAYKMNSKEDVRGWVGDQWESERFTSSELDHIAACIDIIQKWYWEKEPLYEDFFVYLLKGDLFQVVACADNTNALALSLYVKYLYNCLPSDYHQRIEEDEGE